MYEQQDSTNMATVSTPKKAQQNGVTKIINDVGWKNSTDRIEETCLTLFYKIVSHEVNSPSEGILISAKGKASTN